MPQMQYFASDDGLHGIHWIDSKWDEDIQPIKFEHQKLTMDWLTLNRAVWTNNSPLSSTDAGQVLLMRTYGDWLFENCGPVGMGVNGGWMYSVRNTTHGLQFMIQFSDKDQALLFKLTHGGD